MYKTTDKRIITWKPCKPDIFGYDTFKEDEVAFNRPDFNVLTIGRVVSFTSVGFIVKYFDKYSFTIEKIVVADVVKRHYNASNISIGNNDEMS